MTGTGEGEITLRIKLAHWSFIKIIFLLEGSPTLTSIFFLSGFSFTDTDDEQESRKREGTIFYSTLPLPLPPPRSRTFRYLFSTLHVRWLSHIFNRTTCIYQAATWRDLPPYWITIWLIDDVTLVLVCLRDDLILDFLLQQSEMRHRWIRTGIDYHPCITSEPPNQVC